MEYISAKEAAALWGVDASRIGKLAREGRIEGARIVGRNWLIPKNAEKPRDGRTKQARAAEKAPVFRFPFFMDLPEERFEPPLSKEESALRSAELLFLACRFDEAERKFQELWRSARDKGVRIAALFFLCYLSASFYNGDDFDAYYDQLRLAVAEDHTHKAELELLHPWLMVLLGLYKNAAEMLRVDMEYEYSPSVYPLLTILSVFNETALNIPETLDGLLYAYETVAKQMEYNGHLYEAQMLHMFFLMRYSLKPDEKAMLYHLKRAIRIAYEQDFIYPVADFYIYFSAPIDRLLKDYPEDFGLRIRRAGKLLHRSFAAFTERQSITNLYTLLSDKEYQYIRYAVQGYSGEKIAKLLHVSERTVSTHYAAIYAKLGVESKQELAALFTRSQSRTEL